MSTAESSLLVTARQVLATAMAELDFLYHAQAEDVLSVTITSRSGHTRTLPVSRKRGSCLCKHLIVAGEKRVERLKTELHRLTQEEGEEAGLKLRNKAQAA